MLRNRNCTLDLETHKYFWDPDGARIPMRVSVTGVTNHGKDPNRFKGFENSSYRPSRHPRPPVHGGPGQRRGAAADASALKGSTAATGSTSCSTARSPRVDHGPTSGKKPRSSPRNTRW